MPCGFFFEAGGRAAVWRELLRAPPPNISMHICCNPAMVFTSCSSLSALQRALEEHTETINALEHKLVIKDLQLGHNLPILSHLRNFTATDGTGDLALDLNAVYNGGLQMSLDLDVPTKSHGVCFVHVIRVAATAAPCVSPNDGHNECVFNLVCVGGGGALTIYDLRNGLSATVNPSAENFFVGPKVPKNFWRSKKKLGH